MNRVCPIPQPTNEVALTGSVQADALGPIDFQRIGVPPRETRAAVIRTAASRATKSLAARQLNQPNSVTEHQLSRVTVSAYRLLDPRQRQDRQSRAHVGRIRPGILQQAGETSFAGRARTESPRSGDRSDINSALQSVAGVDLDLGSGSAKTEVPASTKLVALSGQRGTGMPLAGSLADRVRRLSHRPPVIIAMIIILLLAAAALWTWGQSVQSRSERLNPFSQRF